MMSESEPDKADGPTEFQLPTFESSPPQSNASSMRTVRGWKRVLFLSLAALFFVLGVVGTIIPVLPTTPFLLLTSYFLLRTSPKLNGRLLRSKFFGPILMDWQQRGGVRRDIKAKAIFVVCLAVALSIYFSDMSAVVIGIVVVAALIGIGVILRLPSL